jgi:hypothetical protein
MTNPFRYFNSSPEVIRLVVMMYVRYPLSLRNGRGLLLGRSIMLSMRVRAPGAPASRTFASCGTQSVP